MIPIESLIFDPNNARKHNNRNLDAIKGSLTKFGAQKPVVINKKNIIIAGNGTVAAAKDLGWKEVPCVRTELPEGHFQAAYALSDNKTAELPEWDEDMLKAQLDGLLSEGFEVEDIGFDIDDIPGLGGVAGLTDEDEVPDVPQNVHNVKLGDIWQLGNHRLMCGDSTVKENVEKLMDGKKANLWVTDPPYGVAYQSNGAEDKHKKIENDSMPLDQMKIFWQKVCENAHAHTTNETPYYWFACQGGDQMMMMMMSISEAGWKVRHELIWAKDSLVMGRCDYHYQHEPIFYGWKQKGTHNWYSDRKQTSLLNFDRPKKSDLHPTMKPVELISYLIQNSSKGGDIVLETFCGSGTTLIACEKTNRTCYGLELDPHYCSVIIQRWQDFSGKKAERIDGDI